MLDALAFLTVLPVGARHRPPGRSSLLAFPLVGLGLGAVWALLAWAGTWLWGPAPAAAAVIVADLLLTGALHLDAVADVADGWASHLPPEEARAVMRDPRVGAVGAATLAATLITRWAFVALLAGTHHWGLLVSVPLAGRAAMVVAMARSPREAPPGIGGSLADAFAGAGAGMATAVAAVSMAAGLAAGNIRGGAAVALGAVVAEAGARLARRRFGALTGDAVGAIGVAAEVVALAFLSARL